MLTLTDRKRLATIRAKLLMFSSEVDTSTWEATFFLDLLSHKDREIRKLKRLLRLRLFAQSTAK